VAETGVTVHFVDEGVDSGPVIAQEAVPIEQGDTPERLRERLHAVEHRLLPEAVRRYLAGALRS
jgi:phosphoribosylglycinamide formyltransferase-1